MDSAICDDFGHAEFSVKFRLGRSGLASWFISFGSADIFYLYCPIFCLPAFCLGVCRGTGDNILGRVLFNSGFDNLDSFCVWNKGFSLMKSGFMRIVIRENQFFICGNLFIYVIIKEC